MKTWNDFCSEPLRHSLRDGKTIYRYISEQDYKQIQLDAIKQGLTMALHEIQAYTFKNGDILDSMNSVCVTKEIERAILTARDNLKEVV
jgi:hypothetical protein